MFPEKLGFLLLGVLHFANPNVPETDILAMLLELQPTQCRSDLYSAVGFLDLDIIVNFYAVPPHRGSSWLDQFVAVPAGSFGYEVEGVPLTIGPPGICVRNTLHTESGNAVRSNLPVVWILSIITFW